MRLNEMMKIERSTGML